jgi:hypothetical protein
MGVDDVLDLLEAGVFSDRKIMSFVRSIRQIAVIVETTNARPEAGVVQHDALGPAGRHRPCI